MINEFRGETRWLSNFELVSINYLGATYGSTEAAFQAQKTTSGTVRVIFTNLSAKFAKALGSQIQLREDWDEIKLGVMYSVNKIKFSKEPYKTKLLETGDQELVEGNNWNDTFWGVCNGVGENHLGKILMKIREELRNEKGTV
jgi:ribA/ribD-fused uncharacterized protein